MAFQIVDNARDQAIAWASPRWPDTPPNHDWGPFTTIHLEKDFEITAVVVYNQYIPATSIDIHVAAVDGGRWLTRQFLSAVFRYPFEQLKVRRVTARIGANNPRAKHFLESLGFTHEGTIRLGWGERVDLLVYGLLRNECRFLETAYNGKVICANGARSSSDRSGADAIQHSDGQ